MTSTEVDRLERYLDRRFTTLEERVNRIEEKMNSIENDMATLRVLARIIAAVSTSIIVIGIIAGISYLAK